MQHSLCSISHALLKQFFDLRNLTFLLNSVFKLLDHSRFGVRGFKAQVEIPG